MKALVLCAGIGTRLRPHTNNIPKPMILVGNQPVIGRIIVNLYQQGITQIAVNLHYKSLPLLNFLGSTVHYSHERTLKGTAGALLPLKNWLSDPFLVVNGDTLSNPDIADMVTEHKKKNYWITIFTHKDAIRSGGTYLFDKKILDFIPPYKSYSIHEDLIPRLLQIHPEKIVLYTSSAYYFDIGTPEGLKKAQQYFHDNN